MQERRVSSFGRGARAIALVVYLAISALIYLS